MLHGEVRGIQDLKAGRVVFGEKNPSAAEVMHLKFMEKTTSVYQEYIQDKTQDKDKIHTTYMLKMIIPLKWSHVTLTRWSGVKPLNLQLTSDLPAEAELLYGTSSLSSVLTRSAVNVSVVCTLKESSYLHQQRAAPHNKAVGSNSPWWTVYFLHKLHFLLKELCSKLNKE